MLHFRRNMEIRAVFLLLFFAVISLAEDFEDLQTEFYLPYSETEDVDFSIQRPGGTGCYQWYV